MSKSNGELGRQEGDDSQGADPLGELPKTSEQMNTLSRSSSQIDPASPSSWMSGMPWRQTPDALVGSPEWLSTYEGVDSSSLRSRLPDRVTMLPEVDPGPNVPKPDGFPHSHVFTVELLSYDDRDDAGELLLRRLRNHVQVLFGSQARVESFDG